MPDVKIPYLCLVEMEQRCRALTQGLPVQQEVSQQWSGIGFRMGDHFYVAPMGEVEEVLHPPRFTKIPGVKEWVKGVANVRGKLLPLIDLCHYFHLNPAKASSQARVLIVSQGELFAGLMVDDVVGMQHFSVESFSEDVDGMEADVRPFLHGAFLREKAWRVFSPQMLTMDKNFLDVAS